MQLTADNSVLFENIIPVLGAFHQRCLIYVLFIRDLRGRMADTSIVAAGALMEGCVDQGRETLQRSECIYLWREAPMQYCQRRLNIVGLCEIKI